MAPPQPIDRHEFNDLAGCGFAATAAKPREADARETSERPDRRAMSGGVSKAEAGIAFFCCRSFKRTR
jgi:hypothetical protein